MTYPTIQRLYSVEEIRNQVQSNQYSAELLLQHALVHLERQDERNLAICREILNSGGIIKSHLIDAIGKLLVSMVGTCTCGARTYSYLEHHDYCTYRVLHECYLALAAILDEVERITNNTGDNNEQQNP